jgi:hypothetical protein
MLSDQYVVTRRMECAASRSRRDLAEVISAITDQLDAIKLAQILKGYIKDAAIDLERYLRFDFPFFFFLSTPGSGFGVDEDG